MSSDDDIEVVEVSRIHFTLTEFIWKEISSNGSVSIESLRAALSKYDVLATDDQITQMLTLVPQNVHDPSRLLSLLSTSNNTTLPF